MSRDSTSTPRHISIPKHVYTPNQFTGFIDLTTIPPNAKSQHSVAEKINLAAKNIAECQQMIEIATDDSLKVVLSSRLIEEQKNLSIQNAQLRKLKRHAEAQLRLAAKK